MLSNLLTTLAVLCVLAAVAALTGNVWWSVLLLGFALGAAGWVSRPTEEVPATRLRAVPDEKAAA